VKNCISNRYTDSNIKGETTKSVRLQGSYVRYRTMKDLPVPVYEVCSNIDNFIRIYESRGSGYLK